MKSEKGDSLIEVLIATAIVVVGFFVASLFISQMAKQNRQVSMASSNAADNSLMAQYNQQQLSAAIQGSIWMNNSVATALGVSWVTFTGSGGSVYWAQNLLLTRVNTALPIGTTPDPNLKSDLVAVIIRSPAVAPVTLAPSGGPSGDYIFTTGQPGATVNITGSTASYNALDYVAIESEGGIEFAQINAIRGGGGGPGAAFVLDWSMLGTFSVGGVITRLPQRYLSPGIQIFKCEVRILGQDNTTQHAAWIRALPGGQYQTILESSDIVQRLQVLDSNSNPPTSNSLPSIHSGYTIQLDFQRPLLMTGATAAPGASVLSLKTQW